MALAVAGFAACVCIGYFGANALESGGSARALLASAADLVSRAQAAVPLTRRSAAPSGAPASREGGAVGQAVSGSPAGGNPVVPAGALAGAIPGAAPGSPAEALSDSLPGALAAASAAQADSALPGGIAGSTSPGSPPGAVAQIDSAAANPAQAVATTELPLTAGGARPAAAGGQPAAGAAPGAVTDPTRAPAAPVSTPPAPGARPASYAIRIPEGRTPLGGDGIYAVREGDVVRVHFDTELGRTRRPAKFENVVRVTLPAILGPAGDSLLRQIDAGRIAASGDLIADLPQVGVELRHLDGRSVRIWPETRPGRDGPLVISYRVSLRR